MKRSKTTDFIEKNVHGAWVIYGAVGVRQYYYYPKAEAMKKYLAECAEQAQFVCQ